jgi:hypothetical protein
MGGSHRSASSIAPRNMLRSARTVSSSDGSVSIATNRFPDARYVVSTPAGRISNKNAKISLSVSRSPSISDSASVLIKSSCGSLRRSARISPKYSFNVADAAIPMSQL